MSVILQQETEVSKVSIPLSVVSNANLYSDFGISNCHWDSPSGKQRTYIKNNSYNLRLSPHNRERRKAFNLVCKSPKL